MVEKQIQPDYPADLKYFWIQPAKVRMTIDDEGTPYSLESATSLPDSVVKALAKWRFRPARKDGSTVSGAVEITVPLHRPIEGTGGMIRSWRRDKQESDAFAAADGLGSTGAARLEDGLKQDSSSADSRLTLLWYSRAANGPEARGLRLRQIDWLAKNKPESAVLGSPLAVPGPPASGEAALYEDLRQSWLAALRANPRDTTVLDHATNFLRFSDPEAVEQAALQAMNENERAAVVLGDLYGIAALGVTAVDPATGKPALAAEQMPTTPFAEKARTTIESTDDVRVLFSALHVISGAAGGAFAESGHAPTGFTEFCTRVLARARGFYPKIADTCDSSGGAQPESPLMLRVGGAVQQENLVLQPRPTYPAEAKARGISATVRFVARIGVDGKVNQLELLSGPLALYQSARDTISRWRYRPTMLNHKPVTVLTTLDVHYVLN